MTRRANRVRLILVLITSGLAVLAVASSILAVRYQDRISDASRYNRTFDLGQAASELLRLQLAFAAFLVPGSPDDAGEVALRYQIIENRVRVLEDAQWESMRPVSPEFAETMGKLVSASGALATLIAEPDRRGAARRALELLHPLNSEIARLSSLAHANAGDLVARNQSELRLMLAGLCLMIIALVAFGWMLLLLLVRNGVVAGRLARRDVLTGVGNRFLLTQVLGALKAWEEHAIVLLDVDHFKDINDTLGHIQGDEFLIALSSRIQRSIGAVALLARLGGDEFAILLKGPLARERAEACCEQILQSLREPLQLKHSAIRASVSMGLTFRVPGTALDTVDDLKNADIALYAAKTAGRGRYLLFDEAMNRSTQRRQTLMRGLTTCVESDELSMNFQPIVDIADGRLDGFEALLRWHHPELGNISPAEFIPLAEESGLIVEIGRWVVEETCRKASGWPARIGLSINVSARQFADPLLVRCIAASLARHDIDARRLTVEITESVLIGNDADVLSVLRDLHDLGVKVALDDFGTGYASLGYLRRFTFDKIKIDQSFVRAGQSDASSRAIVGAICGLAASLGLDIVAEGIETPEHRDLAHSAGCRLGQGYLFDRPLDAGQALARILSEDSRAAILSLAALTAAATNPMRPDVRNVA